MKNLENFVSRDETEHMFIRSPDEAYAGYTISDWLQVVSSPEIILESLKPTKLDDIEAVNQECDICRQSFRPLEDVITPKNPVTLPCGHVFGKDCISNSF